MELQLFDSHRTDIDDGESVDRTSGDDGEFCRSSVRNCSSAASDDSEFRSTIISRQYMGMLFVGAWVIGCAGVIRNASQETATRQNVR